MNCVAPEIAAAMHFWPILTPGGVIVLDDYGFSSHHEQKIAFDRFAKDKQVPILSLPTGQALIFKSK
jgi:O-methyltransferase